MDNYQQFYEQIIGFDNFIEIRCFKKTGVVFSKYFDNYKSLNNFIEYNKDKINLYCGVNPRVDEGRKIVNVSYIKNIVFDIEAIGDKQKTSIDEKQIEYSEYGIKLLKNLNWISNYLHENFRLKINCVVVSGRGMHAYIALNEQLNIKEYKQKYAKWYKEIINYINNNSPHHKEIKCDVMVKDPPRILGAPKTINIKYPEKPIRKIIYLNLKTNNNIKEVLNKYQSVQYNSTAEKTSVGKKYMETTIFKSPEFKIFEYKPVEGTCINNKLRLALKLLMVKCGLNNFDEVAEEIEKLGYPYKDMKFQKGEYPEYKYSEKLLNNYVLDNWDWSQEVGFRIPYPLREEKKIELLKKNSKEDPEIFSAEELIPEITDVKEFIQAIKTFNNTFNPKRNQYKYIYPEALKYNLKKKIKDEKLLNFIEQNGLFERLKCLK